MVYGILTSKFLRSEIVKWYKCHGRFNFKPFGLFQTSVVIDELSARSLGRFWITFCDFEDMHLATVLPWCLLKVRLCSPLQLGNTSCRCVFRLPPIPSSSTSQNPSCTNLFGKLLCTYFYDIFSDTDYVQNRSRKYICLKISSTIAWRRRLGFWAVVR